MNKRQEILLESLRKITRGNENNSDIVENFCNVVCCSVFDCEGVKCQDCPFNSLDNLKELVDA